MNKQLTQDYQDELHKELDSLIEQAYMTDSMLNSPEKESVKRAVLARYIRQSIKDNLKAIFRKILLIRKI